MIKLVCFPHYTCGGLLCDILNDTMSDVQSNGDIASLHHDLGKIGDSDTVFFDYDVEKFMKNIQRHSHQTGWIATHCHPHIIPLQNFEKIVNITTTTYRSKIYRWARSFHHYFWPMEFSKLAGEELIDKQRETAKNYLVESTPVFADNVINLEFSDVVESTAEFLTVINPHDAEKHLKRWQQVNDFLYHNDFWNSDPARRYYEAELEVKLQRYYRYH